MFKFSARSRAFLEEVHPDLKALAERAIQLSPVDFGITDALRTQEEQSEMLASGASTTSNSRHLTGHAIDTVAYVGGYTYDYKYYKRIADAFYQAAIELGIHMTWGGLFTNLNDGCHIELSWEHYPLED